MLRRFASAIAGGVVCALLAAPAAAQLRADLVVSGLSQPVAFVQDPSDPTVQLVVQQNGRVRAVKSGVLQATDYLDLRGVVLNSGEQGLLGLAFAPNYATSGRVFLNFINSAGDTVIARFIRSAANPLRAEPSSRFDLLWPGGTRFIPQDFSNHNGGHMAFGPDGFLYIGMGDGGSGNDPFHNAQNPLTLLGKMLRIDVGVADSDVEGYNVPPTNPFVGQAGVRGEIWSFGWRNPWRWSFDTPARGGTGALIAGDVGQNTREEINYEPAGRGGRNYGWRNREGTNNNVTSLPPFSTPLVDPIFEYPRSEGQSVTGGFVYRGSALGSSMRGRYFFADFVASRVWSMKLTINSVTGEATASDRIEHTAELGSAAVDNPSSFGEDASGELYLVSYAGSVYRIGGTNIDVPGVRRRPPTVAPIGFAVPRSAASATAPTSAAKFGVQSSALDVVRAAPSASRGAEFGLRTKTERQASTSTPGSPKVELRTSNSKRVAAEPCAFLAPAMALFRVLSARDPDAALMLLAALLGANVVGGDGLGCFFRGDGPGADDLAFSDFALRRRDGLERFVDAGNAAAHQLRRAQARHDGKFELIHLDGTIDHGPSTRLRPAMP